MINDAVNPFDDALFKKQVLEKENNSSDESDYEILDTTEENSEFSIDSSDSLKSIISAAPEIPKSAKNMILDASAISKNQKEEKAKKINSALTEVISKYNESYGTELNINFNDLSKTLVDVSDPKTRQTLELYVSEVFKSIKPIMLLHLISKLSLALDYVLQPERMFDSSQLSIPDLFLVIEKLQEYIMNLNEIIDSTTIKDSDQILKKLADEKNNAELDTPESKEAVKGFLKTIMKKAGINVDD